LPAPANISAACSLIVVSSEYRCSSRHDLVLEVFYRFRVLRILFRGSDLALFDLEPDEESFVTVEAEIPDTV